MYADVCQKSALRVFKRHLMVFNQKMVPFALWSNKVPPTEKQALAERLLAIKPDTVLFQLKQHFSTGSELSRINYIIDNAC